MSVDLDPTGQAPVGSTPEDLRLHIDLAGNLFSIRKAFAAAQATASIWEPRPEPPRFGGTLDGRTPFLDEIELPRTWFR